MYSYSVRNGACTVFWTNTNTLLKLVNMFLHTPFCVLLWTICSYLQNFRYSSSIQQNCSTICQIISTNNFYFQHFVKTVKQSYVQQVTKLFNNWINVFNNIASLFNRSICVQQLWPFLKKCRKTVKPSAKYLYFEILGFF